MNKNNGDTLFEFVMLLFSNSYTKFNITVSTVKWVEELYTLHLDNIVTFNASIDNPIVMANRTNAMLLRLFKLFSHSSLDYNIMYYGSKF